MLKTSNVLFNGGKNMKQCFLQVAQQILGVVGFQIETKWIFSLVGILTNFKRCHLQI